MNKNRWQLSITVVLLVLGILLSLQFKTQQDILESLAKQKTEDLAVMWKSLNEKRNKLENEIRVLSEQHRSLVFQASEGETYYQNLQEEITKLRLINGGLAATGPGITVTIDGDTPVLAIDLVDLVNELWASGAEAISINGHRMMATTAITQVENEYSYYIAIDQQRIYYPIVITAIGDKNALEKGLTFPGGIIDNLNSFSIFPKIRQHNKLSVPAAENLQKFQYAKIKLQE
jgi:uncharacterized protein YlxW (UPF0749 family)